MHLSFTHKLSLAALSFLTQTVAQNCGCGFVDSNNNVWRESIVSTFSQDAGALAAVNDNWRIASDSGVPQNTGFIRKYVPQNVFQFNDALGLKTSGYTGNGVILTAEIDSKRNDIKYGTFRMVAQVPSVPGVVFGFFTYINDIQEQDIEFLSSDPNYSRTVHYTNQPGLGSDGNTDPQAAKEVIIPNADFTFFSEHRIDWLPSQTKYYFDGALQTTLTKNVPTTPSLIILNVWSNGDPSWSRGPPTQDAIATVQNVHLYFNSTSLNETTFNTQCANVGRPALCPI